MNAGRNRPLNPGQRRRSTARFFRGVLRLVRKTSRPYELHPTFWLRLLDLARSQPCPTTRR